MIKALYKKFIVSQFGLSAERLKTLEYQALIEAELAEDDDLMIVEDVKEELPTCKHEQELIDWIRSQRVNRTIKFIAIHCTASKTNATATAILNYWKNSLGWKSPGYHILFHHDKGFTVMADLDRICNGVAGFNSVGIQLSYIGGIDKSGKPIDNRSESQKRLMSIAVEELRKKFPRAVVQGHRDFPKVKKACPCFDAKKQYN
jgi:N-acetylmuramoyl-L-alanine amidase